MPAHVGHSLQQQTPAMQKMAFTAKGKIPQNIALENGVAD